jgi:hypothetical protein
MRNNTVFTVTKVSDMYDDEVEIYVDDVALTDCYFKPEELMVVQVECKLTPLEYNNKFDDIIFKALQQVCEMKCVELQSSSELLQDIRYSIIGRMANYHMNVSPPQYKVGDTIYVDNEECKVIQLGEHEYGILSVQFYNVIAKGEGSLLEFITYLDNEDRLTVE